MNEINHIDRITGFRARLRRQAAMMGTFLKTPSPIVCEVLGLSALDCVCIDAEHAPFGRLELDQCIAALRASDMPSLVRVQSSCAGEILSALDCGATGIVLPHIVAGEQAHELAKASHYGPGGRGYAGSSRSARYTTKSMAAHIASSAMTTTLIAQIEDAEALANLDDIAQVTGIDCLFVGRMDLTVSLGASSPMDAVVVNAVEKICAAGKRHQKTVGMFFPPTETCERWQSAGASFFMLASDQQFLLDGARALAARLGSMSA
ncbi:MAG: HpcH/HpaI aldolase family protein [Burkholderiales bacterium]